MSVPREEHRASALVGEYQADLREMAHAVPAAERQRLRMCAVHSCAFLESLVRHVHLLRAQWCTCCGGVAIRVSGELSLQHKLVRS